MNDRKYRQQGYQDAARDAVFPRGSAETTPGRLEGGPRGRGAERNRDEVFRCKSCGERNSFDVTPDASCVKCGTALHACGQCRHFDSSAPFQCRKPVPAAIASKVARNDCPVYEPAIQLDLKGRAAPVETPSQARSAFDKLFGKK